MACLQIIKERKVVIAAVGFNAILSLVLDILYCVNLIASWEKLSDLRMSAPEYAPCNFDVFLDHFYFNLIYTTCFFTLYCMVDISKAILLWFVLSGAEYSEYWASLQAFSIFVLVGHWLFSFVFTPSLYPASVTVGVLIIMWNMFLMYWVLRRNWMSSWVFKPAPPTITSESAESAESGIISHDQKSSYLDGVPAEVKQQGMRISTDEKELKDENGQEVIVEVINDGSIPEGESEMLPTDPSQNETESTEDADKEVTMSETQQHQSNNATVQDVYTAKPTESIQGTQEQSPSEPNMSNTPDNNDIVMLSYHNEVHNQTSRNDGVDGNVAPAADASRNDEPLSSEDGKSIKGCTLVSAVIESDIQGDGKVI